MDVTLRYTLLTLFTLFTLFALLTLFILLYTAVREAVIYVLAEFVR